MIFGIGADIVSIARIEGMLERHGERAAAKILAPSELVEFRSVAKPAAFLAKRFAAKEALGKALGMGVSEPATLHGVAIGHDALGKPRFECGPPLAGWLAERRLRVHLSVSDETDTAIAFVIAEQEDQ